MVRVQVENLRKAYGKVEALKGATLDFASGALTAILGPSGCGKTTLMKIVAGLLPCTRGEVRIDGVPVKEPPDGVGIVFQTPTLLRWRTVLHNVLLPAAALVGYAALFFTLAAWRFWTAEER